MHPPLRPSFVLILTAAALVGCVAQAPMSTQPLYTASETRGKAVPVERVPCPIRVVKITDRRLDPTALGEVAGRPVRGPADTQAWVRSLPKGLEPMGLVVSFNEDTAPTAPNALDATFELTTAWVSSVADHKTASVVVKLQLLRNDILLKEATYRGSANDLNWHNGTGEIQATIDEAISATLKQIADDVRAVCDKPLD